MEKLLKKSPEMQECLERTGVQAYIDTIDPDIINGVFRALGQIDLMTGLYNADGYICKGNELGKQGCLDQYVAFYWNVKNIKLYNQKYGARAGDAVLLGVAEHMRDKIEEDEIAGRLGGDNFVALLHKIHLPAMMELLENMVVSVNVPERGEVPLDIRATTGIYPVEAGVTDMSIVMQKVSAAYSMAKGILQRDMLLYTPDLEKQIMQSKDVCFHFLPALQRKEFQVYYQPKVDAQTMCMVGAEALARWKRHEKILSPASFIPILEQDDSICKLDFYVLEQVCRDLRQWIDQGETPIRISMNFSRKHLSNRYMVEEILEILNRYRIPRRYIEIEITETVSEQEQGLLEAVVRRLHEENIHVSIDDFGSGYSSLNMLRCLDADILKIDRSFISEAVCNEKDRIVLQSIIKLSEELGMRVIIEGVENQDQLDLLQKMNCHLIQGYYFDKPLNKCEFDLRMSKKRYN